MAKPNCTKEEAQEIVAKFRELGVAFVEDEWRHDGEGNEIYNPTVKNVEAEAMLLNVLMGDE